MSQAGGAQLDRKSPLVVATGVTFSATMALLGHLALGPHVAVLFSVGFVAGLLLWLARPMTVGFETIRTPYLAALAAYVIHRTDEEVSGFVAAVEVVTGRPAAAFDSPVSITLAVLSLLWFLAPLLVRRGHAIGYYGAWTVFASLGLVEIGHFVFPLFTPEPYAYFPGMITAPLVIAVGFWGVGRLFSSGNGEDTAPPASEPGTAAA